VLVCLAGYAFGSFYFGFIFSWGYFVGALAVALISWLDDLFSLPFWSRLIVHILAAVILIWDVGFWPRLFIPFVSVELNPGTILGGMLAVVWVVWLLNAYNFMDGIDGIAATQAIVSGVAWIIFARLFDLPSIFFLAGMVASSSAGFLIHNWQPAKVFMGDVGSAFLGFTLAAIPFLPPKEPTEGTSVLPAIGVLFVWFFVFDTVFTFIRRAIGKQRVWEAHREHIYQRLIIEGQEHSTVTLIYGFASILLCLSVLLASVFLGIYGLLPILSLTVLTLLAAFHGLRKKR
jgi:UDP-N-acetylmuramyl pentapeptide phosphotransferase/UDP-N-acetylglucosamine-1-phosphate transferase